MSRTFRTLLAVAITALFLSNPSWAQDEKDVQRLARRGAKIATTISNIQIEESSKIPAAIMAQAKGIIVLRQYEAGVIFGAKGGFGLAMRKNKDGTWSSPAWIKTGEISGGLQLGVQTLNVVLLIMNDEGLGMLDKARFQIGVDASVTRGPTGSNYESRLGNRYDLLAYTDTEGLYAGATFEGGFLLADKRANQIAYGDRLSVPEIINDPDLVPPAYSARVVELLKQIENGEFD